MNADAARWAAAPDLPALGELVIAWLNGEINETPLHEGPPCEGKLSLAPVLTLVNRAGFITDNAERGGSGYGGDWAGWIEGFADDATVARLTNAVAGTGLTFSAKRRFDRLADGAAEDYAAWTGFCVAAAGALDAAWHVTIDDPEPGRDTILWPALEAFASAVAA